MSGLYLVNPEWGKVSLEALLSEGAEEVRRWYPLELVPEDKALVMLVDNGNFMVAALMYSQEEWTRWFMSMETRPKWWLLMNKERAHELAGYEEKK